MSQPTDLTRWNRAGLSRFRYLDGNAATFLEDLRQQLLRQFADDSEKTLQWEDLVPSRTGDPTDAWLRLQQERQRLQTESSQNRLDRLQCQYHGPRRDWAWEIVRGLARSCHIMTEHLEAYANEGFLGTASQWEMVRRLVAMIDYHPAPPASASTRLIITAKSGAVGTLAAGFQVAYTPPDGKPPVVFETLEDLELDATLNALRPLGHDRNQERLRGHELVLAEVVTELKIGDPLIVEDEKSGVLRAHIITGSATVGDKTRIQVVPRLSHRLRKGYAVIHVKPAERLAPLGPAANGAELERVLRLVDLPSGLIPGQVIWISDGEHSTFRRVRSVRERLLVLDDAVGQLRFPTAWVGLPVLLTVRAQEARPVVQPEGVIYTLRVVGDWSRLADQRIVQETIDNGKSYLPFYTVTAARYHPADQSEDPLHGHTILTVSWQKSPGSFPLRNPQTLLVPPVALGPWRVDSYLEKVSGHLPVTLVCSTPKKATNGDLAVVVTGHQTAWARLAAVAIDPKLGKGDITAADGWQDRGGSDFFLHGTTIHAQFKEQLRPAGWQVNRLPLAGNRITLADPPATLKKGRSLVISRTDLPGSAFVTTVQCLEGSTLVLGQDLPADYTVGTTLIAGNVVLAGHGEKRGEKVLGCGAATAANQSFIFAEPGISFVADPLQPAGVRAAMDLRVAGRTWQQVGSFVDSGPTDPHYTVRITEAGTASLTFGDGVHGRRLPSGTNNLRLTYRSGAGLVGNLPAGCLGKPTRPNPLVAQVTQPFPAIGGNDLEGVAALRENAPATLLTLERAVSLDDFAFLAMAQSSVWQARAFSRPTGRGRNEQVEVVVVPAGGGSLGPLADSITDYLLTHALPGVEVSVVPYQHHFFALDILLTINTGEYNPDDVATAVKTALQQVFSLQRRKLGQDLFLSEVYQVVEGVVGVEHSVATINDDHAGRPVMAGERDVLTLGTLTVAVEGAAAASSIAAPVEEQQQSRRTVASRGIQLIQGIGASYAAALETAGVRTLAQLCTIDPAGTVGGIASVRLWEFRTKAEIIVGLVADRVRVGPLLNRPVRELAEESVAELSRLTGESSAAMTDLTGKLRLLQIAMDEESFVAITLRELLDELL